MTTDTSKTGFWTRTAYSVGSVAAGVKDNGFATFMMVYFNQVLGLPALYVGLALLIAMAFDAITDPYVGYLSDRWISKLGRRHPLMYAAMIPTALFYFWLWNPPADIGTLALFSWLLVMAVLARLTITFFEVPNSAMLPELDRSYDGRTKLAGLRYMFGWLGAVVMSVIAFEVYLKPVESVPGILNRQGYEQFALLAAIVMVVSMLVSAVGTHRVAPQLPTSNPASIGFSYSFLKSLKSILQQSSFKAVFLAALFSNMVLGITITLQVYFGTFYFGLETAQLGLLALTFIPAAIFAYPLSVWLSDRREKKDVAILLTYASIITASLIIVLKYAGLFPDNGSALVIPLLALNYFFNTLFLIALQIVLFSMTADLVEANERVSGHRAEGLFMSTFSFTRKVVTGLGMFCSSILLSLGGTSIMDEGKMRTVAIPYVLLITVLYLISILFLHRFTLTRSDHDENLEAIVASSKS